MLNAQLVSAAAACDANTHIYSVLRKECNYTVSETNPPFLNKGHYSLAGDEMK